MLLTDYKNFNIFICKTGRMDNRRVMAGVNVTKKKSTCGVGQNGCVGVQQVHGCIWQSFPCFI